ncbi:putative glycoside hydrolase [Mangrovihabitans endophyticus]|nr:putative glycoside hydrolase [Mangrovihabitans endophyticus]
MLATVVLGATTGGLGAARAEPSATPSEPSRPATAGRPQTFWLHLNSTATTDAILATEARRRSFIVLNAWEENLIPKLKAANPAIQVYVYKDLSSTRSYACHDGTDDADLPTGVGYCDADAHHRDWFLTAPDGTRYQYDGYPGHWQMDVGNVAYQDAWAANVIRSATAAGFDGVEMDNALFTCDGYHEGSCPARYPNDAAMQGAYRSMLANVRDDFVAAGLKAVANLANARLHAGVWDSYVEYLDGGFDEWWLTFSDTDMLPEYDEGWSRVVSEIETDEANGKITWVQPHFSAGAVQPFRYAFASYLMAAGSRAAFTQISQTDGYGDPTPWHAEYDWDLGAATGARSSAGTNLWRRSFTCGLAVVNANPTGSGARSVALGGSFVDQDGRTVTSVSLPGTSGAVLRKPGCTP